MQVSPAPLVDRKASGKKKSQFSDGAWFLNEARAVNIIQHPSLASAFEFGRLPDGSAYIIMEYLDGETLRERLRRNGALGLDGIRIARQITSALVAAHAKHIVHRDLKPANIMLVADPDMVGGERVKVLDFGIAKLAPHSVPGQVETRTGAFLGSPGYMSPEQCRNVSTVDERSDVYSLGAILYEMLCGRAPFVANSDAEMIAMHLFEKPHPLHKVDTKIRPELSTFVDRMLRKLPTERPDSTEVLAFLNRQAGFPAGASMPHQIIKAPRRATAEIDGTTLSQATGQGPSLRAQRSLRWAGLFAVLILITGGALLSRSLWSRDDKKVPAAPLLHKVLWTIDSTPAGAEVVNAADRQVLGHTPLRREQAAAAGSQSLLLRHPGYAELPLTLDRSANSAMSLTLSPLPVAAPPASDPASAEKTPVRTKTGSAVKSDKRRRAGKTTNADIDFIK